MRRSVIPAAALLLAAALLAPPHAEGATRKRRKTRRPARTPAARPYYGPPAPTPPAWLRAAGSCMEYTPGQHLVLAEVGATGRVFRIDADTKIEAEVRKGARLRVLFEDGPSGPVARRVLPGPVATARTPRAP